MDPNPDQANEITGGLQRLTEHLDSGPGLVDRRRRALTSWALPRDDWEHLSAGLPAAGAPNGVTGRTDAEYCVGTCHP
ncbi:hypothetical protein [Streptomyces sp. NPDC056255]|uniref:hypothetical protein n=1 Tax=Streptomyces sp. NPDC056255 TaxID=3345764 RepID=UPI0035E14DB3